MSFINPEIRKFPARPITAISDGGKTIGQLAVAIAIAIVDIVVSTLSAKGIPTKFAVLLASASANSFLIPLINTALGCIILGIGMPTLPA